MSILDKNNEMIRMVVPPKVTHVNWYAPFAEHLQAMTDMLDNFEDCFQDAILEIVSETKFDFSTSQDMITGIETRVETLTNWHPNWYILLVLDGVLPKRLPRMILHALLVEKLNHAIYGQDYDHSVEPLLNFYWLEDPSHVLIEVTFKYEQVLS